MSECPHCGQDTDADAVFCPDCAHAVAVELESAGSDGLDDRRRNLLESSVDYLQHRLDFVDDKANVFIAIQTGFFVAVVWLIGAFFLPATSEEPAIDTVAVLVFLLVDLGFVVVVVALLLHSIRPTETFFSLKTGTEKVDTPGVMWPGDDVPSPSTFLARVATMSDREVDDELLGTVYVLQQQVEKTYGPYRWAVLVMKVQILVVPLGFVVLAALIHL